MVRSVLTPVIWIGSAKDDLVGLPHDVVGEIGYALFLAQQGKKQSGAKPLHGFGGAGVLEIVESHDGDAYRAVYTVRFTGYVYVLHVFQKKSKSGVKTPRAEIDVIKLRLKRAEEHYTSLTSQSRVRGHDG